ncbi:response regulator [Asaia krungthepensis]|uniref:LuxR family transcriptional regulator n=1 Tax=Asaia krungthepensis NRIC 0535 TaxID=1307925 RepID=A0ABQ0Q4Y6_9PROT|nr:response regulator [Asaia krungthepensis]GBQ91522.1 LuxR family transcriptional regulator [Asaia krungthepensis NRIC 0535]
MNADRPVILVIDDDPAALGMMDVALDAAGFTVLLAQSGQAGFAIMEHTRPDLALVDAMMPGMNGWEVCARMASDPELSIVPVIFMTGLSEIEHVLRAFEVGAQDYVTKPFAVDEVLARIRVRVAASQRVRAAHAALDRAGRFLFGLDIERGHIAWSTPQAAELLNRLPADLIGELVIPAQEGLDPGSLLGHWLIGETPHKVLYVGREGPEVAVFKIAAVPAAPEIILQRELGLSAREAEVLLWISRGKSSRDIADILGVSSRTIDKHTEQIYNKAGLSGRAAAASTASRLLREAD